MASALALPQCLRMRAPPAAEDEDAYVWVQTDSEEDELVELVSERLDPEDALACHFNGEQMLVSHRGAEHLIPLAISPHDRYILVSSLAVILQDGYRFFQHKDYLGESANGLYVARIADAESWQKAPKHLMPFEPGYDYFAVEDFKVPYLGHLDNNPKFDADRARYMQTRQQAGEAIDAWLKGEIAANPEMRKLFKDIRRLGRPWWKFWD